MRAVLPYLPGAVAEPRLGDVPPPEPAAGEVRLRVAATALNRADLMQMRGQYPPPPGESAVPGLECAGWIEALGAEVEGWQEGERAMALVAGGGQAEQVIVPAGQLMRVPADLSLVEAAALPEAAITSWTNLVAEGGLRAAQTVMITAAASGVGCFAVQLARAIGARVLVAGRDRQRLELLCPLGADATIVLRDDLTRQVRDATDGRGVDLVMDMAGGQWTGLALTALADRGKLVLVGLLAGTRVEVDLAAVLKRRLQLVGSVLRARSRAEKAKLVADFSSFAESRWQEGALRPRIHQIYPFNEVARAYDDMQRGGILGKLVLKLEEER